MISIDKEALRIYIAVSSSVSGVTSLRERISGKWLGDRPYQRVS